MSVSQIHAGKHCQSCFTLEKTQQLLMLIYKFCKISQFPLIMMQTHMLLDHCLDMAMSWRISLQNKLQLKMIPDFRISAKNACLIWFIFHLSRLSVIEIGSD